MADLNAYFKSIIDQDREAVVSATWITPSSI